MSNGQIIRLIPYGAAQVAGYSTDDVDPAFPATNLADPQPKTVFQSLPAAAAAVKIHTIDIDLLSDTPLDTVAVMFTNVTQAADIYVYGTTSAFGGSSDALVHRLYFDLAAPGGITQERRQFALAQFASVSRRYIKVQVVANRGVGEVLRVGICAIGQTIAPAFNFELGSGRRVEDQSIVRTLPGGETAIRRGGRTPVWRGTWSNLTEAEYDRLWSLMLEVGIGAPVLIVEDTDKVAGLSEGMHYGLLTGLDFTERVQLDKQRIDLTIREMI